MVYCDQSFGPDGLAIVPTVDGKWIVITVAVRSSSSNNAVSTDAVDVPDVLLNCGTASLCNGYRRPKEWGSRGAGAGAGGAAGGAAGAGAAVTIDKHAVPVVFSRSVDKDGVAAVRKLLSSGRVAGFLRLQVVLPRSGARKDSAFKQVDIDESSCAVPSAKHVFFRAGPPWGPCASVLPSPACACPTIDACATPVTFSLGRDCGCIRPGARACAVRC